MHIFQRSVKESCKPSIVSSMQARFRVHHLYMIAPPQAKWTHEKDFAVFHSHREKSKEGEMSAVQTATIDRPLAVSFARASELTSISKNSLRKAARNGVLPTVRWGRRRIIPFAALNDLLRNGLGNDSSPGML
jgi:excisionase family DNA binding protein